MEVCVRKSGLGSSPQQLILNTAEIVRARCIQHAQKLCARQTCVQTSREQSAHLVHLILGHKVIVVVASRYILALLDAQWVRLIRVWNHKVVPAV